MMFKRRFVALILAMMVALGTVSTFALGNESNFLLDEKYYKEAVSVLNAFGIIEENGGEIQTEKITRYEFICLILDMYEAAGVGFSNTVQSGFNDIESGTEAEKQLGRGISLNVIHGDGTGGFRPDDIITDDEAYTIALNVLGYNKIKDQYKTYAEYLKLARKISINKNVYAQNGMSYGDAYALIYNMLKTEVLAVDSISSGKEELKIKYVNNSDDLLAKSLFGVNYFEGVMTSTPYSSLTSADKLDDNEYKLTDENKNSILLNAEAENETDYSDKIGMSVRAFYRENNGRNMIVFLTESLTENTETEIKGKNFIDYDHTTNKMKYLDEKTISELNYTTKEKSVTVPVNINIVYNSAYVYDNKVVFDRLNEATNTDSKYNIRKIRLLDNNNDGKVDVIFVNMYINYLVERITKDGEAMDYYTKKVISLKNSDIDTKIMDENGNKIDYTSIKANDVLCIEKDITEKELISVNRVRNSFEGVLSGKKNSDGAAFIINDETIKLANGTYIQKIYDTCTLSNSYTFYLDICGNIAGYILNSEVQRFGYVLATAKKGIFENITQIKMVVPDDSEYGQTISVYTVKNRVKINGELKNSDTYDYSKLPYMLIRFKINSENEITAFDTPAKDRGEGVFSYVNYKESDGAIATRYRPNWGMLVEKSATVDDKCSANFAVDNDTIILAVPEKSGVANEESRIARIEKLGTYFNDWREYTVHGYVTDENDLSCKVLTVLFDDNYDNAQQAALARQRVFIVDSVGEALNSDGNLARLIEGMENKKRAAYTSEERYIKNYSTGKEINVHKGDVLQVMLNAMGDIRSVRRLYDAEKNSYDAVSYSVATDNNTRMTIGNVFSTKNNSFSLTEISKPKTWEYAETFVCGGDFYVYVYDKATDKVSAGSYNDITADESTQVVVFASTMTYLDVVVYK